MNKEQLTGLLRELLVALDGGESGQEKGCIRKAPTDNSEWWKPNAFIQNNRYCVAYVGQKSDNATAVMYEDENKAFYGRIKKLIYHERSYDKNRWHYQSMKVCVLLEDPDSGSTVIIESGIATNFARGLLLLMSSIQDPNEAYYISPSLGKERKDVVFCTMHDRNGNKVQYAENEWREALGNQYLLLQLGYAFGMSEKHIEDLQRAIGIVEQEARKTELPFQIAVMPDSSYQTVSAPVSQNRQHIHNNVEYVDMNTLLQESDRLLRTVNWTPEQGQQYLIQRYGKRSRQLLNDQEMMDFVRYLRELSGSI